MSGEPFPPTKVILLSMLDDQPRPDADSPARLNKLLKSRLADGAQLVDELLSELGDLPVPGVPLKTLILAKCALIRWAKEVRTL